MLETDGQVPKRKLILSRETLHRLQNENANIRKRTDQGCTLCQTLAAEQTCWHGPDSQTKHWQDTCVTQDDCQQTQDGCQQTQDGCQQQTHDGCPQQTHDGCPPG